MTENYKLREYITEIILLGTSPLIDKKLSETELSNQLDIQVLQIILPNGKSLVPDEDYILQEGNILLVEGDIKKIMQIQDKEGLAIRPDFRVKDQTISQEDITLAEIMLPHRSNLIGQTLKSAYFRDRYDLTAIAIRRSGELLRKKIGNIRLRMGDLLLVQGKKESLMQLTNNPNLLMLNEIIHPQFRYKKMPIALFILVAVVGLATLNIFPIMVTAVAGCILMVLTGCLKMDEIYRELDWSVVFLLAGILTLGVAMEKTGTAHLLAQQFIHWLGFLGPIGLLSGIYLFTALLTEGISNNASAVLLAPIVISVSESLHLDSRPFLFAIMFAASTSFMTPIGYQTNYMVYNPGGYKFSDYFKVGAPLNLLYWILATWLIPVFWPLQPQ